MLASVLLLIGFVACEDKKEEDTPTTTTTTTTTGTTTGGGNNTKTPTYNTLIINDTVYDVTTYGQAQSAGDYSYFSVYVDSAGTVDMRALFNPQPAADKQYTIIPGAPSTDDKTQLTLTYNQVLNYNAVNGGTVDVKVTLDSTIIKFNNVKFSKAGSSPKMVSGYLATEN